MHAAAVSPLLLLLTMMKIQEHLIAVAVPLSWIQVHGFQLLLRHQYV
jgi:hypothetical protein